MYGYSILFDTFVHASLLWVYYFTPVLTDWATDFAALQQFTNYISNRFAIVPYFKTLNSTRRF